MTDAPLEPLPVEQWEPSLERVIDDMHGKPLNVHGLMAHHAALLTAWWSFRNYSVTGGELDRRRPELVILSVAKHVQNWYEWASHVDRGLAAGVTMEEIERLRRGRREWAPADQALIDAVQALLEEHRIPEHLLSRLREHYRDRQIMDVIFIHGAYLTLGGLLNTFEIPLDESVAVRLPPDAAL